MNESDWRDAIWAEGEALRRFLCDVSGSPAERVHVVAGDRVVPDLPARRDAAALDIDGLARQPEEERSSCLVANDRARRLRDLFASSPNVATISDVREVLGADVPVADALRLIDLCTTARRGEQVFLPLRGHLFCRTQAGLWACANRRCQGSLGGEWAFGAVCTVPRDFCRHCEHPVYEIVQCRACGELYLDAEESFDADSGVMTLRPPVAQSDEDGSKWRTPFPMCLPATVHLRIRPKGMRRMHPTIGRKRRSRGRR